jgi:hypothetical protein
MLVRYPACSKVFYGYVLEAYGIYVVRIPFTYVPYLDTYPYWVLV